MLFRSWNLSFCRIRPSLTHPRGKFSRVFKQPLGPSPLDLVLDGLLDETDAFEDIGNVINSSFLDIKLLGGIVKINFPARGGLNHADEFLS